MKVKFLFSIFLAAGGVGILQIWRYHFYFALLALVGFSLGLGNTNMIEMVPVCMEVDLYFFALISNKTSTSASFHRQFSAENYTTNKPSICGSKPFSSFALT